MNALYKDIIWDTVRAIGFDMDGTLYDEYDFIQQVYCEINTKLINNDNILDFMLMRWLEKGSSYPYIFDEVYSMLKKNMDKKDFINSALNIYRNYSPILSFSNRSRDVLNFYKNNYSLFLISDGNYNLQQKKYNALGLSDFFDKNSVIFTGQYSSEYHKPNTKSLSLISIDANMAVFFGDRCNDMEFALATNMQFHKVYNMVEVSL